MKTNNSQRWNPDNYAVQGRFVADLGMPVIDLLNPKAGERILDLGCGDGALTIKLVELGCAVVGVDASAEMISVAQDLGLDAQVMDGNALTFQAEFDAVFSNAAIHWMQQPEQVIHGVWQALKPGGRFVGEFGAEGNIASIVTALEAALKMRGIEVSNPWFFPSAAQYQAMLEAIGFEVQSIECIPRPTLLPGDVGGWLSTFAQPFLSRLPQDSNEDFIAEVVDVLRPELCDANGDWYADYVRLRFAARKPG